MMFRLTASALALVAAFSLIPIDRTEAGSRSERQRVVKQQTMKMIDRSAQRRHPHRAAVVVVKVDGDRKAVHRRHRSANAYRPGNTYSGDVVIDVRPGVGQWSYGALSSSVVTVRVPSMAKIIDVKALGTNSSCQMQAGVCIIKP
jgi:hypothetical protein